MVAINIQDKNQELNREDEPKAILGVPYQPTATPHDLLSDR